MPEYAELDIHPNQKLGWIGTGIFALIACTPIVTMPECCYTTSEMSWTIMGLCVAGFVLGLLTRLNFKNMLHGWYISCTVLCVGMAYLGPDPEAMLRVCFTALLISIPLSVSALLANSWRTHGRLYMWIWLFSTVILGFLPYAMLY